MSLHDRQGWDALKREAAAALGEPLGKLEALERDAGARAYARVTVADGARSVILVDASRLDPGVMERFWRVADALQSAAVNVPRRLAQVPALQLSVTTDLGRDTLSARFHRGPLDRSIVRGALAPLVRLGEVRSSAISATYDPAAELLDFAEIFVPAARAQGWEPPASLQGSLDAVWAQTLELSPVGLVHTDYHSRNIVIDNRDRIGMVDFQDAAYGPIVPDWAAIVYDHNRRPNARDIALWEGEAATALRGRMPAGLVLPCLRSAGLFWHLRLAGACSRLLREHGRERFGGELRSVSRWLFALSDLPELTRFRALARSTARGAQILAGEV